MVFTPYLTVHRHPSITGQVLLFSTKTGALVLLPEEEFTALQHGDSENEYAEPLTEMGFLVADPEAERREVFQYMDAVNRYNPNLTLAIILVMECNFACQKLLLQFYGGEPLLYKKRILYLAQRLKPYVEERGGGLCFDLVSNGSLLTEKVVDELNVWGLDGVKVTIDGPPENHNHFRPFKSGG